MHALLLLNWIKEHSSAVGPCSYEWYSTRLEYQYRRVRRVDLDDAAVGVNLYLKRGGDSDSYNC